MHVLARIPIHFFLSPTVSCVRVERERERRVQCRQSKSGDVTERGRVGPHRWTCQEGPALSCMAECTTKERTTGRHTAPSPALPLFLIRPPQVSSSLQSHLFSLPNNHKRHPHFWYFPPTFCFLLHSSSIGTSARDLPITENRPTFLHLHGFVAGRLYVASMHDNTSPEIH